MADATKTVGRFEIVERIGRGGMAVVYLARQPGLDRVVALKELRRFDDESDGTLAERFLREARMAGSLSHPNVVTVFDYFEEDGTPYIAMEYMERGSLRPLIGTLSLAQIAGVLQGVLAGLGHAEARGIVHRDLKPENLLVGSDGGIKIADLGIAKAFNQVSMGLTKSGMAIGTPTYMAPEQATAKGVGPWTDLYATGVIAYELLVGRVPFLEADTPLSILWQHVNDPIPSPRELQPQLDPRIADWLQRMLAKVPEERPRSAREAWHELEEIVVDGLGWRWRQSASLLEPAARAHPAAEAPVGPELVAADGFETFEPNRAAPQHPPPATSVVAAETNSDAVPELDETVAPTDIASEPAPALEDTIVPPPPVIEPSPTDERDESFEFPRENRRLRRDRPKPRRILAAGAGLALAAGVAAVVAIALGDGGGDRPPPPPPLPDPKPLPSERVGLSVSGSRLYVASLRGRVVALDGSSLRRLAGVTDAAGPRTLAVRGPSVWVAGDGTVTRFSSQLRVLVAKKFLVAPRLATAAGAPLAIAGKAPGGRGRVCVLGWTEIGACAALAFVPAGLGTAPGRIFVADERGDAVVPLRVNRGELVALPRIALPPGSRPHGRLAVFAGRLYVPVNRGIAVLDLSGTSAPRKLRLATTPADLWIVPFNGNLFAPLYAQDRVALFDLTSAEPRPRLLPAGSKPVAVAGDQVSSLGTDAVYVANAGDGSVTRLHALTGMVLRSAKVRALRGRPIPPVVVGSVRFARKGRVVTARIALTGGRLEAQGLRTRDGSIADGTATLELWQGGIGAAIARRGGQRATIRLTRAPGRVIVRIAAPDGAFERITARLVRDGHEIRMTLIVPKPPEIKPDTGTDDTGSVTNGNQGDGDVTIEGCAGPRPPTPPGGSVVCRNGRWVVHKPVVG